MIERRNLTDDEQALFENVAKVCGLELAVPDCYLTDDSPSQDVLKELVERGVDALGIYNSSTGNVTLFVERCAQTAKEFKVSPREVELIVLAHEWAHRIQHQGKHPNARVAWEDFPRLPQRSGTDTEDLAQTAAYLALPGFADGKALQRTMRAMADRQPAPYKKFLKSGEPSDKTQDELRWLMEVVRYASKPVVPTGDYDS